MPTTRTLLLVDLHVIADLEDPELREGRLVHDDGLARLHRRRVAREERPRTAHAGLGVEAHQLDVLLAAVVLPHVRPAEDELVGPATPGVAFDLVELPLGEGHRESRSSAEFFEVIQMSAWVLSMMIEAFSMKPR